jgi:hypothetical protein
MSSRGWPRPSPRRREREHLVNVFQRIEGKGFNGYYTNAFGSLDDMLAGRDELVRGRPYRD